MIDAIDAMPDKPRGMYVHPPPDLQTATAQDVISWTKRGTYYGHELRVRDVSRYRRAELYDQGFQWLREAYGGFEQGSTTGQWVEMYWSREDPAYIPTPVFNEGLGARINESARLGRPNYRPKVAPKAETPDLASREGAKAMQDSIVHTLHEIHWQDKVGPLLYLHMPLYGGAYWKSFFSLRWDKTITAPVQGAASCPECGRILSNRQIEPNHIPQIGQSAPQSMNAFAQPMGIQGPVSLGWCPWCENHPPLQNYDVTLTQAMRGQVDEIGRPLSQQLPSGDWEMEIPSPYDIFMRNMGLDQSPGDLDEITEAHVEHLDWIGLRWPDKVGKIKPESPSALAREHPVAGAPDLLATLLDSRLFENCARVIERHKKPWMEQTWNPATARWEMQRNLGRSSIVCGDQVLFWGPYLMQSANYPGQTVERVIYDYIPWEYRDGGRRLQGLGLWDTLFDPQDASNEIRSQTQAVRKRLAVPLYIALATHNFQISGMRGGLPGMLAEIDVDPNAPGILPQLINNTTIDAGVREELKDALEALQRVGGNIDVEQGNPPPGVSAGNAIAFLKGASSERREPRLARIKDSLKRAWSHGARIKCHMYAEPRPMKYKDEDTEERWKYMHGLDFNLQTDVEVDAEPDFDNAAQDIEKVRDAIQMGVVNPQTASPSQIRAIGRTLKLPEAIYDEQDRQDKDAQREAIDYRDQNVTPRIDPGTDDHSTHFQVHGAFCQTAFFRQQERDGHWDDALQILGESWNQTLMIVASLTQMQAQQRMQALLPMLMQALGAAPPPIPGAQMLPGAPPPPGVGMGAPSMGAPPVGPQSMALAAMPPPVAPQGPAIDLQERIVVAWMTILFAAGFGVKFLQIDPKAQQAFRFVAVWRAHMEAHRILDEQKQQQAAVQPTLAAPGSPTTAAGNQPTEGAPASLSPPGGGLGGMAAG